MEIHERLVSAYPSALEYQSNLAMDYNNFGAFYRRTGDQKLAEQFYEKALATQERLIRVAPSDQHQVDAA